MTLEEEINLIDRSKKDPTYFEPIYNHYFKIVFSFILKRVGDKEATADLTSQVFLKALTNLKKYEDRGFRFSSWLIKIADNETKHYFRKTKKTRNVTLSENGIDMIADTMEESNKEGLINALIRLLQNLEEEALQLIELRFFEQKSFREIGYVLDITENNAKVRTYRLLDKLRIAMDHEKV